MSKLTVVVISVSLLIFELCIIVFARYLGLSQFASVGAGLVPALLLAFPVIKWWSGGNFSFTQWSLTIGVMVIVATLIHFVIS